MVDDQRFDVRLFTYLQNSWLGGTKNADGTSRSSLDELKVGKYQLVAGYIIGR